MSNSLGDLLKQKQFEEPAEIAVIKRFLQDRYQATGKVTVRQGQILIAVPSAALAGTLRMQLPELQKLLQTEKKLLIRIG